MLPYLIAGAIGFGIGKLFENGGETFMAGGMTNEDILRSFLTSERETQTNNLATFYSTMGGVMLLRNYGTLIAKRMGRNVEITNVKHSKTTSSITNRLKALAEEMGYNVSFVSEFENGGEEYSEDKYGRGRRVTVVDFNPKSEKEYDIKEFTEIAIKKYSKKYDAETIKKEINRNKDWYDYTNETQLNNDLRGLLENLRILEVGKTKIKYINKKYKINDTFFVEYVIFFHDKNDDIFDLLFDGLENKPSGYYLQFRTDELKNFEEYNIISDKNISIVYGDDSTNFNMLLFETESETPTNYKKAIEEGKNKIPALKEYFVEFLDKTSDLDYGGETFMAGGMTNEDIIFEYPKDLNGRVMSWINVGTGNMEIASKTGTVGQVRDGHQLIVLKSETPNKVDYHILVDYLPEENKINMVRGKFNSEPSPKYESYINDLFRMLKISQTTRDYQDEDIANQVYVKRYLINNFGNPPKGCQIKATELGVEIHFDSTNKMSSDWAMKIADKYGYPSGNFEMRYSSGSVPITYVDTSKIAKNTSKSGKGYFNFGETFMAGGIGESDDKYGGQRNKIINELKGMKGGLNNKAPYVFVKEGYIYVSAENGDNYADYYEYTIDEKLEDLADRYNTYWDWETAGSIVLAPIDTYGGGGLPKKRRRSASLQYGRSDTSFDKQLTAKPVGYRFTNAKANQLRKDPFAKPTEAQVKKYLGKGIYKENRRNRSDRDRNVKL